MKRAQLKSPLGSPAMQQSVRAKQKKGAGGEGTASGSGGKAAAERKAAARAWEANNRRGAIPLPPVGPGVEVTPEEAMTLEDRWDREMDELLREGVLRYGAKWEEVSTHMKPHDCPKEEVEKRWEMIKGNPVKGPWSPEEDALLKVLVDEYGSKKWSLIATQFPGRSGKQCRERWLNHLDIRVRKSAWTGGEDVVLCEAQERLGNKWSEISKLLPGRAENAVKNRFNSIITKRLAAQGISVKGSSGLEKASIAKSLASAKGSNGSIDINALKSTIKAAKQKEEQRRRRQQQQQRGATKAASKRPGRKTRAPIGFKSMDDYESEWSSSDDDNDDEDDDDDDDDDDDNDDMEIFPGEAEPQPATAFPLTSTPADPTPDPTTGKGANPNPSPSSEATGAAVIVDHCRDGAGKPGSSGSPGGNDTHQKNPPTPAGAAPGAAVAGGGITRGAKDVGTTAAASFSHATAAAAAAAAAAVASASAAATAAGTFAADALSSSSGGGGGASSSGAAAARVGAEGAGEHDKQLVHSICGLLGGSNPQRGHQGSIPRHQLYDKGRDGAGASGAFSASRGPAPNDNKRSPDQFLGLNSAAFARHPTLVSGTGLAASGEGAVIDHASAPPGTAAGEPTSAAQGRVLQDYGAAAAGLRGGGGGGARGSAAAAAAAMRATKKRVEEELETFRQYQNVLLSEEDMRSIQQKMVEKERQDAFSQIYSASPKSSGDRDSGLIMPRVGAAVPTRKAAMEIEAGGGVDVREGQASAITEIWSKVQIKGTELPHAPPPLQTGVPVPRTGVGTRSLAAAAVGGAGGGGLYSSHNRTHHHHSSSSNLRNVGASGMHNNNGNIQAGGYLHTQYYPHRGAAAAAVAGAGSGFGSEGAAISAAAMAAASSIGGSRNSWTQQLDQLRTDDVIPTPLEIGSPGGPGDILSLSCLGSYMADVKLPSSGLDGNGRGGTGHQATFPATAAGQRCSGDNNAGNGGGSGSDDGRCSRGDGGGDKTGGGGAEAEGTTCGVRGGSGDRGRTERRLSGAPPTTSEWGGRPLTTSTATAAAAAAAAATPAAATGISTEGNSGEGGGSDSGGNYKRPASGSDGHVGRMDVVMEGGNGSSVKDVGGGGGGGAVLFDVQAAAVLQHEMQALSIDDEPSPGWSQLRPDVAGVPGPAFDGDALPMGLTSASDNVLGVAQGFPVPPSYKLRGARFPLSAAMTPAQHVFSGNLPPTPGFAASPLAPTQQPQQHAYPMFATSAAAAAATVNSTASAGVGGGRGGGGVIASSSGFGVGGPNGSVRAGGAAAAAGTNSTGAVLSGVGSVGGMGQFSSTPRAVGAVLGSPGVGGTVLQQRNVSHYGKSGINLDANNNSNSFRQLFTSAPPTAAGDHRDPSPYGGAVLQQQRLQRRQQQRFHQDHSRGDQQNFNICDIDTDPVAGNGPNGGFRESGPPSFPPPSSSRVTTGNAPADAATAAAAVADALRTMADDTAEGNGRSGPDVGAGGVDTTGTADKTMEGPPSKSPSESPFACGGGGEREGTSTTAAAGRP